MVNKIYKNKRPFLPLLLIVITMAIIAVVVDVGFFYQRQFDVPKPSITLSTDPSIIARGEYLVYGPGRCADCHGAVQQRAEIESGEKVPLSGGFYEEIYLGKIVFVNITPDDETGIGKQSDADIFRFLRTGINHKNEYGLPFMDYRSVSDDDLLAIISFLRSQKPVYHKVKPSSYNFLGKLALAYFVRPEKAPQVFSDNIAKGPTVEYGRYLVETIGACRGCHTQRSLYTGEYTGNDFEGGMLFKHSDDSAFNVISPDLTPNLTNGTIAGYSKENFLKRMQDGLKKTWSPMPWGAYSRMSETDIEAIFLYLSSLRTTAGIIPD